MKIMKRVLEYKKNIISQEKTLFKSTWLFSEKALSASRGHGLNVNNHMSGTLIKGINWTMIFANTPASSRLTGPKK